MTGEETLGIIMLLFFGAMFLFSIGFYIMAGIYIVNDSKKENQNTGVWALVHFLGYFFIGTWGLGIYQIVTKKTGWGIFWIAFPFVLSAILFVFILMTGVAFS